MSEQSYRHRLEAICNNASVALFVMDGNQHCTYMNPAAVELTGYELDELRGAPLHEYIHHSRPDGSPYPLHECPIDRAFPQMNQERGEEVFVHKDGHFYNVAFTVSPLLENGETIGAVMEVQDISARKRREAHSAFLAEIVEDLNRLASADEILQTAGAKIGAYLQVATCNFHDVNDEQDTITRIHTWGATERPALGTYRLADYTSREFTEMSRRGEAVVVCDTERDLRTNSQALAEMKIRSFVSVPLRRRGTWKYLLAVTDSRPRDWQEDEVQLFKELATRIFPRLERARAEEALRDSEARYRLIGRATNDIIWNRNLLTDRLEWNEAMFSHLGLDPAELDPSSESWYQRIHPAERAQVANSIEAAIAGDDETWTGEYRFRKKDGSYATFLDRGYIARDSAGVAYRMIGSMLDLTERRQMEEALRESEERQTLLVRLGDSLRPLADPVSIQAEASRLLGEYLGASRVLYGESDGGEEFVVHHDYCRDEISSAAGRHRFADFGSDVAARLQAGESLAVSDVCERPEQGTGHFAGFERLGIGACVAVPLVKRGRLDAFLAVNTKGPHEWTPEEVNLIEEVAERTWSAVEHASAEEALRKSESRYRTLFESIDQGFGVAEMIYDANEQPIDFRWVETNPAFERHTGFSAPSTKTARELVSGLEESWVDIYGRVARTGESEHFVRKSEALGRWFEVEAFRVGDADAGRVAVLFTDVTERKRAEQTLREADRRKDEFLAMLAHELRNPLAAIKNVTHLLGGLADEPRAGQYVEILARQTGTLGTLVDDLLDVSRITRGLIELEPERVHLTAIVERALESARSILEEKGHEVSLSLPSQPLPVVGDPVRLEQILVNLLTNAAKYTDRGGQITLSLAREGEQAELRVKDTGIGMTPEILERIFDLFGQAERGLARSEGGLGIGLTIVKRLVQLHGGSIRARSAGLSRGAEFVVRLPTAASADQEQPAPAAPVSRGTRKQVLLVEDSPDIATTLALLMEEAGHQVTVADDGPSALRAAEEVIPDVVLLDIGLPHMDGYEVARRLRENPFTRNAVLAALTGYGQARDRDLAKAAGFDAHFVKPVDLAALQSFIDQAQPDRGAMREPERQSGRFSPR